MIANRICRSPRPVDPVTIYISCPEATRSNHSASQAPFGTQLEVLSVRLMRNAYRHPLLVALNFAATLAAAVGLALIFHNTGTDTGGIQNRCTRRCVRFKFSLGSDPG